MAIQRATSPTHRAEAFFICGAGWQMRGGVAVRGDATTHVPTIGRRARAQLAMAKNAPVRSGGPASMALGKAEDAGRADRRRPQIVVGAASGPLSLRVVAGHESDHFPTPSIESSPHGQSRIVMRLPTPTARTALHHRVFGTPTAGDPASSVEARSPPRRVRLASASGERSKTADRGGDGRGSGRGWTAWR